MIVLYWRLNKLQFCYQFWSDFQILMYFICNQYNNYKNVYQIMKVDDQFNQKQKKPMKLLHGRWSKTEKQRFFKGLQLYGRDWGRIQKMVKTRQLSQIRSHAQKIFLKKQQNKVQIKNSKSYQQKSQNFIISLDKKNIIKQKQKQIVLNSKDNKLYKKQQIDLVDIFMKAIQNEEREDALQHMEFLDIQSLDKDQETRMKPEELTRNCLKSQQVLSIKDNSGLDQIQNKILSNRFETKLIGDDYIQTNFINEVEHR